MIFKKIFCFLLLFFVLNGLFFVVEDVFASVACNESQENNERCGKDIENYGLDHYLYKCTLLFQQGPPTYNWIYIDSCSNGCTTTGTTADCNPAVCTAGTVPGGPPGSSRKIEASDIYGSNACARDGVGSYEYVCDNGTWKYVRLCENDCSNGTCSGGGGNDTTSDSDENTDNDSNDTESAWEDEIFGNDGEQSAENNNSGANGNGSGGGGSWFGINTADGVGWALSPGGEIDYFKLVLEAIIGLAGVVAAGFIVFGAYTLITASGEPENIAKGQKMITNAVIGLIIAALAFLIVNFVIVELPMPE